MDLRKIIMKCPNRLCGPLAFAPKLRQAGIGNLLQCPVCRKYWDINGTEVAKTDALKENHNDSYDDNWDGYLDEYYNF